MEKSLKKVIKDIIKKIKPLLKSIYLSPHEKRIISWVNIRGDRTLRLDYDELSESSVVFDIGGYEGQWASDIFSKYSPLIYVFEPVEEFANQIIKRFSKNKKILVYKFGLAARTEEVIISLNKDSSSVHIKQDHIRFSNTSKVFMMKAEDFIIQNHITTINLMKINIEGGEYELIEHLIDTGIISIIDNLQVQFHNFVPNADQRMSEIQSALEKTHHLTYQYPFVWENWKIKEKLRSTQNKNDSLHQISDN